MSYAKRILYVDLTTGKTETKPLKEELAKNYIGGIGLGMRLFLDNSKPGVDPFSPENPIIFITGPLTGTMAPSAGNSYAVVSKSPLTEGICECKAHGFFGAELKRAGYDAIIFRMPHSLGHGVGLQIHESPRMSELYTSPLKAHSIVTVEPGLYDPQIGGVRLEDIIEVTKSGYNNLTKMETQLEF